MAMVGSEAPYRGQRADGASKKPRKARRLLLDLLPAAAEGIDGAMETVPVLPPGSSPLPLEDRLAALRSRRGDVDGQLSLLTAWGLPEPLVVPVSAFARLASLQRAQEAWRGSGGQQGAHREVACLGAGLADFNKRDPLSDEIIASCAVPLSTAPFAMFAAFSAAADYGEPLSDCPARLTAAIAGLLATAGGHLERSGGAEPAVLLLSLALPRRASAECKAAAAAARPLFMQCCRSVLTFGQLPAGNAGACLDMEVIDFEPLLRKREHDAMASTGGGLTDAEVKDRVDKCWEVAERLVAAQPPKKLPRFRSLLSASSGG